MSLTERVNNLFEESKRVLSTPKNRDSIAEYLRKDKNLQGYLSNPHYDGLLEQSVDRAFDKYHKGIDSFIARIGTPSGALIGGIDIAGSFVNPSLATDYTQPMLIAKTIFELPKVYEYLKNSADLQGVKGLAVYGLRKAAGLIVPWFGPFVEGGALRDMLCKRVVYEAKRDFLKKIGRYESTIDRVKDHVRAVAGPWEEYAFQ